MYEYSATNRLCCHCVCVNSFVTMYVMTLCVTTGPGVLSRLLHDGDAGGGGHTGDVQSGHAEPPAYARQVPLRFQPARLLPRHPGGLPHQEGPGGEQESLHQVSLVMIVMMVMMMMIKMMMMIMVVVVVVIIVKVVDISDDDDDDDICYDDDDCVLMVMLVVFIVVISMILC